MSELLYKVASIIDFIKETGFFRKNCNACVYFNFNYFYSSFYRWRIICTYPIYQPVADPGFVKVGD